MGVKIDQFDIPVCNCFQPTLFNDQLCYEVDLSKFTNEDNVKEELKSGFNFIMDYNEDRQVTIKSSSDEKIKKSGMSANILESNKTCFHLS